MFNLLPAEDREAIQKEYKRRLLFAAASFLLFGAVSALFLLAPSLWTALSLNKRTEENLKILRSRPEVISYASLAQSVGEARTQLDLLKNSLAERTAITPVLSSLMEDRPNGVKIEAITWMPEGGTTKLKIEGLSDSRDLLRSFVNALGEDATFSSVDVPVSSFAKSLNADFSMTLDVKKTNER